MFWNKGLNSVTMWKRDSAKLARLKREKNKREYQQRKKAFVKKHDN